MVHQDDHSLETAALKEQQDTLERHRGAESGSGMNNASTYALHNKVSEEAHQEKRRKAEIEKVVATTFSDFNDFRVVRGYGRRL